MEHLIFLYRSVGLEQEIASVGIAVPTPNEVGIVKDKNVFMPGELNGGRLTLDTSQMLVQDAGNRSHYFPPRVDPVDGENVETLARAVETAYSDISLPWDAMEPTVELQKSTHPAFFSAVLDTAVFDEKGKIIGTYEKAPAPAEGAKIDRRLVRYGIVTRPDESITAIGEMVHGIQGLGRCRPVYQKEQIVGYIREGEERGNDGFLVYDRQGARLGRATHQKISYFAVRRPADHWRTFGRPHVLEGIGKVIKLLGEEGKDLGYVHPVIQVEQLRILRAGNGTRAQPRSGGIDTRHGQPRARVGGYYKRPGRKSLS